MKFYIVKYICIYKLNTSLFIRKLAQGPLLVTSLRMCFLFFCWSNLLIFLRPAETLLNKRARSRIPPCNVLKFVFLKRSLFFLRHGKILLHKRCYPRAPPCNDLKNVFFNFRCKHFKDFLHTHTHTHTNTHTHTHTQTHTHAHTCMYIHIQETQRCRQTRRIRSPFSPTS